MTKFLLIAGIVVALIALAWAMGWVREDTERSEWLGLQRVDDDFTNYRRATFQWTVIRAGHAESGTHEVFLKIHDASERLGLCGYMLMRQGGHSGNALRWLADARLLIGAHKLHASFINGAAPGFSPGDAQAGCVVTDIAWDPAFADLPVRFDGPPLNEGR